MWYQRIYGLISPQCSNAWRRGRNKPCSLAVPQLNQAAWFLDSKRFWCIHGSFFFYFFFFFVQGSIITVNSENYIICMVALKRQFRESFPIVPGSNSNCEHSGLLVTTIAKSSRRWCGKAFPERKTTSHPEVTFGYSWWSHCRNVDMIVVEETSA